MKNLFLFIFIWQIGYNILYFLYFFPFTDVCYLIGYSLGILNEKGDSFDSINNKKERTKQNNKKMETQNNDPMVDTTNFEQFNMLMKNSNSNLGLLTNVDCNIGNSQSHQLVSTNSFELNAGTSLSEDSGLPHTNSSISSGDSIRVGLCKFEFEVKHFLLNYRIDFLTNFYFGF